MGIYLCLRRWTGLRSRCRGVCRQGANCVRVFPIRRGFSDTTPSNDSYIRIGFTISSVRPLLGNLSTHTLLTTRVCNPQYPPMREQSYTERTRRLHPHPLSPGGSIRSDQKRCHIPVRKPPTGGGVVPRRRNSYDS